jgi:hypothetical protein
MDIEAAKSKVSESITDGLCPCRGCTVARKKVFNDIYKIINTENDLEIIKYKVEGYRESGYGVY